MTPLYIASQEGHTGVVELLLQHNADPNISDEVSHSMIGLHVHVSITQCIIIVLCVLECFNCYYYFMQDLAVLLYFSLTHTHPLTILREVLSIPWKHV